jgi:YidC/Oxa1 family membrane protein insertase
MDKRTFLAIGLSILILVIYQEWMTRYYAPPPSPPEVAKEAPERTPPREPAGPPVAAQAPVEIPVSRDAKEVRVETDNYVALFTNQGARVKSFKLKKYRTSADENSAPLEMVPSAAGVPLPLGIQWQRPAPFDDSGLIYSVQGSELKLTGDSKGTLIFNGRTSNGTVITKKLTFIGSTYPIELEVSLKAADGSVPPEIALTEKSDHKVPNPDAPFEGFLAFIDNKIRREAPEEVAKGLEFSGNVAWEGFGHTYFIAALLPENGAQHRVAVRQSGPALVSTISGPASQTPDIHAYTVFFGPKELETLKAVGRGLERSIDFGYFGFISVPFLYALHFFHRFTGSYGMDIILLTVVIKVLMAPLTHKSFVSMKQMQKLQPQMERLKEKYKNDKEKLNKEIMELYRRNGVNPLGGCLPMVLQFPVFIGLYNALSTPIELRHAPFLWIKDLSRPDWESLPFTIGGWQLGVPVLTILMGASMFIQQWMTPTAGDPNQRKLMLMMPLMFTFMFVSFPAGLTVYWLVNNILTIAQQYWINRKET